MSSRICSISRNREAKLEVRKVERKRKTTEGRVEVAVFDHDGGPGSNPVRELSSASRGRKGPRSQREQEESWILKWCRGVEDRDGHLLAGQVLIVEVAKRWRTRDLDVRVFNQQDC